VSVPGTGGQKHLGGDDIDGEDQEEQEHGDDAGVSGVLVEFFDSSLRLVAGVPAPEEEDAEDQTGRKAPMLRC